MPWWAWLLVDLFLVVGALVVTLVVTVRTWRVFRLTFRRISALEIPRVERR